MKEVHRSFPTNLMFLCFANTCNYISVIVQAETVLMQVCTFFKYGILGFLHDIIELYTIDAKTPPLKLFIIRIVNFIVNTLNLRFNIKILTAAASISSRYVYVKQMFDV